MTTAQTVARTEPGLDGVLDDIRSGLDRAAEAVDGIISGVEAVLDALPDVVADGARAAAAELRRLFAEVVDHLAAVVAQAGDPAALRQVGARWVDGVGGPTSLLVGTVSANTLDVDDAWTGVAADAYRSTLPAQQAALGAIQAHADEVDATLNELANAITKFWLAVSAACIGLAVTLAGAVAGAATVVGAPVSITLAVTGIGATTMAVLEAGSSLTDIMTEVASRSAALDRRLANSTAFPLGSWPRSTTDASGDGSIRDGDDTGWHVR